MQTGDGVWYPRGGTRAVAEALIRLAEELGVELHRGNGVQTIHTGDRWSGRRESRSTTVSTIPLAAVVSNCDSVRHASRIAGRHARGRPVREPTRL